MAGSTGARIRALCLRAAVDVERASAAADSRPAQSALELQLLLQCGTVAVRRPVRRCSGGSRGTARPRSAAAEHLADRCRPRRRRQSVARACGSARAPAPGRATRDRRAARRLARAPLRHRACWRACMQVHRRHRHGCDGCVRRCGLARSSCSCGAASRRRRRGRARRVSRPSAPARRRLAAGAVDARQTTCRRLSPASSASDASPATGPRPGPRGRISVMTAASAASRRVPASNVTAPVATGGSMVSGAVKQRLRRRRTHRARQTGCAVSTARPSSRSARALAAERAGSAILALRSP